MRKVLQKLIDGRDLSDREAFDLLARLCSGDVDPIVRSAVLATMRAKGETADELRGFARAMRGMARRPRLDRGPIVDMVGTGGDGSNSLNISTGSALLAAASGLNVVKHGNRAVSSRAGSADLIEQIGLPLPLDEFDAGECLRETGFTFLFAPYFHPAMAAFAPVRSKLRVRTIFNEVGPLTNPAQPPFMVVGAYSPEAAERLADALSGMPIERAFVVHGSPGWDEATPVGPFLLLDVRPGSVQREERDPESYGVERCSAEDLLGGDSATNARALRDAFEGKGHAYRQALILNAALTMEVTGTTSDRRCAADIARRALDDGRAERLLGRLESFGQGSIPLRRTA